MLGDFHTKVSKQVDDAGNCELMKTRMIHDNTMMTRISRQKGARKKIIREGSDSTLEKVREIARKEVVNSTLLSSRNLPKQV